MAQLSKRPQVRRFEGTRNQSRLHYSFHSRVSRAFDEVANGLEIAFLPGEELNNLSWPGEPLTSDAKGKHEKSADIFLTKRVTGQNILYSPATIPANGEAHS